MEHVKLDLQAVITVTVVAIIILGMGIWRVRLLLSSAATHNQESFELVFVRKQIWQMFLGFVLILLSVPILLTAVAFSNYYSMSIFLSAAAHWSGGKESQVASAYLAYGSFCMIGGLLAWAIGSALLVWPVMRGRPSRPADVLQRPDECRAQEQVLMA